MFILSTGISVPALNFRLNRILVTESLKLEIPTIITN